MMFDDGEPVSEIVPDPWLSRYAKDATRLTIGGFADDAFYALSSGITKGDLFTHVLVLRAAFHFF
jgi:predicted esterase